MSAFVVCDTHLDALLTAACAWDMDIRGTFGMPVERLGILLRAVNQDAVNDRYADSDEPPAYRFAMLPGVPDPAVILKGIRCYSYQSSEHHALDADEPGTVQTARRFLASLETLALAFKPRHQSDVWEIRDRDIFGSEPSTPQESAPTAEPTTEAIVKPGKPGNVEIRFPGKPSDEIRAELKEAGYRWLGRAGLWYGPEASLPSRYPAPVARIPSPDPVLHVTPGSGDRVLQIAAYRR